MSKSPLCQITLKKQQIDLQVPPDAEIDLYSDFVQLSFNLEISDEEEDIQQISHSL